MIRARSLTVLLAAALTSCATTTVRSASLYVGLSNQSIAMYDTNATTPMPTNFASTGANVPGRFVFDAAGNLYMDSINTTNTIYKFTPGGVGTVFASTGLNLPTGLAFDAAGNLYVANGGNNTIEKFTPGGVGSVFASMGLNTPSGLAFDASGNLYVANALTQHDREVHAGRRRQRLRLDGAEHPRRPGVRRGGQPLRGQRWQQHDREVHAGWCRKRLRLDGAERSRRPGVRRGGQPLRGQQWQQHDREVHAEWRRQRLCHEYKWPALSRLRLHDGPGAVQPGAGFTRNLLARRPSPSPDTGSAVSPLRHAGLSPERPRDGLWFSARSREPIVTSNPTTGIWQPVPGWVGL